MVSVLDCTLRDGGYYTDWDFSDGIVDAYIDNVARLPVEYLEVGYVNDRMPGYSGKYFYLDKDTLATLKRRLHPSQKLIVMIDGKSGRVDRIAALFGPLVGTIDGVRLTAAPNSLDHVLALANELKSLGLSVGFNIMYMSTYYDDLSILDPIVASQHAYDSVALVDSFGGCLPEQVARAIADLKVRLPGKLIGFHGHDNMCLAFANTLAAIAAGADIVDGTFTGMGRGAGNARTETILIHVDQAATDRPLDHQALAGICTPFEEMRKLYGWGTNLPYMLSGANNLPQKDVMDWLAKNRYSIVSIIRALQHQGGREVDGQSFSSVAELKIDTRKALLIGGGQSVIQHLPALARLIAAYDPIVIFSSSRHLQLSERLGGRQLICFAGHDSVPTSLWQAKNLLAGIVSVPPRVPGCVPEGFSHPVYQSPVLETSYDGPEGWPVSDASPLSLSLGAIQALGIEDCWLVGFDGYDHASAAQQELSREVQASLDAYDRTHSAGAIASLTPSKYRVETQSLYGLLAEVS